jgi:hypothetical protein
LSRSDDGWGVVVRLCRCCGGGGSLFFLGSLAGFDGALDERARHLPGGFAPAQGFERADGCRVCEFGQGFHRRAAHVGGGVFERGGEMRGRAAVAVESERACGGGAFAGGFCGL